MQDKVLTQTAPLMQLISCSSQFSLKKLSDLERKGEERAERFSRMIATEEELPSEATVEDDDGDKYQVIMLPWVERVL